MSQTDLHQPVMLDEVLSQPYNRVMAASILMPPLGMAAIAVPSSRRLIASYSPLIETLTRLQEARLLSPKLVVGFTWHKVRFLR